MQNSFNKINYVTNKILISCDRNYQYFNHIPFSIPYHVKTMNCNIKTSDLYLKIAIPLSLFSYTF